MSHRLPLARAVTVAALALATSFAHALTVAPYSPARFAAAQQAGEAVVLHFHADWCPTCRAQDKVLDTLKTDPALKLVVMQADYDTQIALEKQMKVTAQSTFVVFHGAAERARATGETDPARLKALLAQSLH